MAKKTATTEKTALPAFKAVIVDNTQLPVLVENWDHELLNTKNPKKEAEILEALKTALAYYTLEEYAPEIQKPTGFKCEVLTHELKHTGKLKPESRNLFLFTGTNPGGELLLFAEDPKTADPKKQIIKPVRLRSVFITGAKGYQLEPTAAAKRFVIHLSF